MGSEEGSSPFPLLVFSGKPSSQCKLLETIFEDPKHGTDGREQLTSVRRYKRYIEFTTAPNASKKWKRSQKARKLAVYRLSSLDQQCQQDVSGHVGESSHATRTTRRRSTGKTKPHGTKSCLDENSAAQNGETVSNHEVLNSSYSNRLFFTALNKLHAKPGSQKNSSPHCQNVDSPETFVVSNSDLFVEEAATVELPLEWKGNEARVMSSPDGAVDTDVRSSGENLVTTVVKANTDCSLGTPCQHSFVPSNSDLWCYNGDEPQAVSCVDNNLDRTTASVELHEAKCSTMQSCKIPVNQGRRRTPVWSAAQLEKCVSGTVTELIAIIETADNLCDSVVENCSISNFDAHHIGQ